jgi:hypothetical protein
MTLASVIVGVVGFVVGWTYGDKIIDLAIAGMKKLVEKIKSKKS